MNLRRIGLLVLTATFLSTSMVRAEGIEEVLTSEAGMATSAEAGNPFITLFAPEVIGPLLTTAAVVVAVAISVHGWNKSRTRHTFGMAANQIRTRSANANTANTFNGAEPELLQAANLVQQAYQQQTKRIDHLNQKQIESLILYSAAKLNQDNAG